MVRRITLSVLSLLLVASVAFVTLIDRQQRHHQREDLGQELKVLAAFRGSYLENQVSPAARTVLLLAQSSSLQGLLRSASNEGLDPLGDIPISYWEARVSDNFRGVLHSNAEYSQVRYIGLANGGREIIRADRKGNEVYITPEEDLQEKAQREYFLETLQLEPGEVYVSTLDLNRENDRIEVPHVRSLRVATTVFTDAGVQSGLIVINIDVGALLDGLSAALPPNFRVYLLNQNGDFLVHPQPEMTFGFDTGLRRVWSDFSPTPLPISASDEKVPTLRELSSSDGPLYAVVHTVRLDPQNGRYLSLVLAVAKTDVSAAIAETRRLTIGWAFALTLVLGALLVWLLRRAFAPLALLVDATREIGVGHFDSTIPEMRDDEIGLLADAMRQMRSDIRSRSEEILSLNASLEKRVELRTAELAASNKELEAFTYSVSHDLRAPLRAIDGFSRLLEEEYGPVLDQEGSRLIAVVRNSSQRMSRLIDDLLAFSRLGRQAIRPSRVDMTQLVRSVFEEIAPAGEVDLALSELPPVTADPALIRQVWVNLISNAVKYSRSREPAVIELSGAVEGNRVKYQIKDNGVGFDMNYSDKLFGVFQRLHSETEFEGTGVGLALVQRIITRHGGEIWAVAKPEQGATFGFWLPIQN